MDFDLMLLRSLDGLAAIFTCVFFYQRFRWKRNKRLGKSNWGFYPSTASLGNALQELQTMAEPQVHYVLEEKTEDTAEDDETGPDDPTAHLRKQAERIRRGDRRTRITVRLQ